MSDLPQIQFGNNSFRLRATPVPVAKELPSDRDELFAMWSKDPKPEVGSALLRSVEPDLEKIVRKYTGGNSPVALGRAKVLAIHALPKFDPKRGVKLQTYLDRQLQPLQRWSARKNIGVRMPTALVQDLTRMRRVETELGDELGREPSWQEIADKTGLPLQRIRKLNGIRYPRYAEQQTQTGEGTAFADDEAIEEETEMWPKTVYHSLNPMDQIILQHTTGLYGSPLLSNQAIAKKLKISPGAVSQRKARIQRLLDEQFE